MTTFPTSLAPVPTMTAAPEGAPTDPAQQIKWTPRELREMIEEDTNVRRKHTDRSRELIEQYHAFEDGWPLNFCFEWMRSIVPQLIYQNPQVRVTEAGFESQETYAVQAALRSLLNREDYGFVTTFQAIAHDVQLDYGVCYLAAEPTPEYQGGLPITPQWIKPYRVSPRMFGIDHRAPEFMGQPRYAWHMSVADRNELKREVDAYGKPIYDAAALDLLQDNAGMEQVRKDLVIDRYSLRESDDMIVVYEVYLYAEESWVTIGFGGGGESQFLRVEPQRAAYCCPRGGPYVMFGTYPGIDYVYPVPVLGVASHLGKDINEHRRINKQNAGQAKRIGIASGGHAKVIQKIQTAKSGDILAVNGFVPGMVQELQVGGVAKESFEFQQYETEQMDRLTGLTEIARGNLQNRQTATAVAQAGSFTAAQLDHAKAMFARDTGRCLARIADVLMHCDQIMFPVSLHDDNGTVSRGMFYGGQLDPQQSAFRKSITVEIEPYSFEYVNKQQLREDLIAAYTQALGIMQQAAMNPAINPQPMIDDLFQTLNIPRAAKRYFNTDINAMQQELVKLQMGAQAAMAMGGVPAGPGGQPGAPAQPTPPEGSGGPPVSPGSPRGLVPGQPSPV